VTEDQTPRYLRPGGSLNDRIAQLREKAKKCLTCKVPMIGTVQGDKQKYCSPECRKEAYKGAKKRGNNI